MPLTPSAIRNRRIPITFDYAGEAVSIEYYAARLASLNTARFEQLQADLEGITDEHEAAGKVADILLDAVASWDLAEDDGAAMPLSRHRLVTLIADEEGTDLVTDMLAAIAEDVRQRKGMGTPTPAPSGATSSRKAASTSGESAASRRNTR